MTTAQRTSFGCFSIENVQGHVLHSKVAGSQDARAAEFGVARNCKRPEWPRDRSLVADVGSEVYDVRNAL